MTDPEQVRRAVLTTKETLISLMDGLRMMQEICCHPYGTVSRIIKDGRANMKCENCKKILWTGPPDNTEYKLKEIKTVTEELVRRIEAAQSELGRLQRECLHPEDKLLPDCHVPGERFCGVCLKDESEVLREKETSTAP